MRIMAVDYGDVRTGIAVSDETLSLTGDAWVTSSRNEDNVIGIITDEAVKRGVSTIVIGYPKNMDGTIGPRAEKSERLAGSLREACNRSSSQNIEVILRDERLTTLSAQRVLNEAGKFGKKRKKTIDAVAASLILEDYLVFINKKK